MASIQKINSPERPQKPIYSHAVKVTGGLIFLSGQVPVDKEGNPVPGDVQAHTKQCLSNLADVLKVANSSWDKVVKVNIYLKNMDDFDRVNETYTQFVPEPRPARTCIQAGRLPHDFDVEIEAIAAA
ncbi:Endoribonuclease L-PSP [Boletus edulis]|uniref:Endoribonuclease L-PSP n=1 Tax=Boletus edulis BED1 TaxID=1328754 RepID=A0AAD4GIJ7_BOLED|nr:Endoribonuclease L-PSP [Boletus edulis]KAF8414381.1 Endoribonuclease L-PSP [Boletus edulis BED1]KAF8445903.1 Endoribonuclease L-PSP [Boletus edulis BED1]